MALTKFENVQTVTTTEHSLPNDATYDSGSPMANDGVMQAVVDLSALEAGDEYRLRIYERTDASGTQRVVYEASYFGVQSEPNVALPALIVCEAWDVTLVKVAGTDRSIRWSIRLAPV
jgi:hypothetical protein